MPETTKNYHHVPVAKKNRNAVIRTISVTKGIKALYDVRSKSIVTYLFDVDQYTMKEAKDWVKRHKSSTAHLQVVSNLILADYWKDLSEHG